MADRGSLGLIGFIFGGVTLAVALIGGMVVSDHVSGRLSLDNSVRMTSMAEPVR